MTAIAATFADFKTVKTRSTAQLILELPIEQADAALKMLGGVPIPGKERWVGIAPLALGPPSSTGPEHPVPGREVAGSSPAADAKPPKERRPFHSLPRATQATLLCQDERFRHWIDVDPADDGAEALVKFKARMGIASRTELDRPGNAERFDAMVGEYDTWRRDQELPEVRG